MNLTNLKLLLKGNILDESHANTITSSVKNCLNLEKHHFLIQSNDNKKILRQPEIVEF